MNPFLKLTLLLVIVSGNACFKILDIFSNTTLRETLHHPTSNSKVENVRIQVYYEALCGDCRKFDSTQLVNVVKKLSKYIDLTTYPYGNAKTRKDNEKYIITCQHGPPECYGNKLHACAIDALKGNLAVLFNACMMDGTQEGSGSDDKAADVCANSFGVSSEQIKQCANSEKGDSLLKFYGDESKKVNYHYVPFVLITGKQVDVDQEDFMQAVCSALANPPDVCKTG